MPKDMYNFDAIPLREGTGTLKFDAREQVFGRPDVLPMWIADMDFACPPAVGEAISRRAAHNVYGYDFGGERSIPSVQYWLSRRNEWTTDADWFRFTTGVVSGLGFAVKAFTSPGDDIVIQTPVYAPFRTMSEVNGRRVITSPLRRIDDDSDGDGLEHGSGLRFEPDFDDLDRKLAGARAIILCNPHNPVGRIYTPEELRKVGELCEKHDVTIISDEIHCDLVFAPHRHTHIAAIDGGRFAGRTITFLAPSKTFNIAGLATSAAIIASESMRAKWDAEYGRSHIIDGTVFGHVALRAAYDECEDWLEELLNYLKNNVQFVCDFLAANIPAVRTVRQEGTYLMWLDFRGLGFQSHNALMAWLVNEAGLGLSSGADFGVEGIGFARMNVATNRATIEKAMARLASAAQKLNYSTPLVPM